MIDPATRDHVRRRARDRCEYCGIAQAHVAYAFQVEHIIARQHGGSDGLSNLALACERCNAYKGPNLSSIDPVSGNIVPLFNPRLDRWHAHFEFDGALIVGISDVGRATAKLLNMNSHHRVELRRELGADARPPQE